MTAEKNFEPHTEQVDRRSHGDDLWRWSVLRRSVAAAHMLTNGRYGFHRDELQVLSDARHLDWGFVPYPPLTPFVERIGLSMFGLSLVGLRLFSVIAQAIVILVTGLMARELGGGRLAQVTAALAVALSTLPLFEGTEFQYTTFDYLWWALIAYFVIRLLKTEDPRWWLAIGATIGVGFQTKYTMGFFLCGLLGGVLLTGARRYLASGWFWGGMALGFLVCPPNLIWQVRHEFISLHFLQHIHARDVSEGRAKGFLARSVLDLRESSGDANLDRGSAWLSAGPAVSDAGVDVCDPAGAVCGGEGQRLLPGRGVSDADGYGRCSGGALGWVLVEDSAAGRGKRVLRRASGVGARHECGSASVGIKRQADEVCAGE